MNRFELEKAHRIAAWIQKKWASLRAFWRKNRQKLLRRGVFVFGVLSLLAALWLMKLYREADFVLPAATALFEDRTGRFLAEDEDERLGFWAPPAHTPERITRCVIALEDRRFASHSGVDFRGLARAFWNNLRGKPQQGASTLAMQVARLQKPAPRTYLSKLRECVTAWILVHKFGRQAVLRQYLTLMPEGNRMFGAAYAARRYFRKPLADLSWAESALLAALPKAPSEMNLYRPTGRALARARAVRILNALHLAGQLDDETWRSARAQLRELHIEAREIRPEIAYHAILRLRKQLQDKAPDQPIRSSLDLELQERLQSLADQKIEGLRKLGVGNLALLVVDARNGEVLAYLGSANYRESDYAGAIDYANTPRSSGSTLKPFFYGMGLERELFTPASVLADLPLNISYPGGQYSVHNYDNSYLGPMPFRQALANSRNIPAVSLLATLGVHRSHAWLCDNDILKDGRPPEWYGLGLAIGGAYVTLTDLVAGYGILAREGAAFQLRWLADQGAGPQKTGPLPPQSRANLPPFSRETARQISLMLSDPQARLPSFPRGGELEYPFPVAVKTGTSQGFRDAWCVAYSRRYLVGAWLGHPDNFPMNRVNGQYAAGLVQQLLLALQPEAARGVDTEPFLPPEHARQVALCPLTGELASENCDAVIHEYFLRGKEPLQVCRAHLRLEVDRRDGRLADADTPLESRVWRNFVALPPAYASWAARQGLQPPPIGADSFSLASLSIQSPAPGSRIQLDPDTPTAFQSLALRALVEPRVPEIVWYVNGKPWRSAAFPYELRWPLRPGQFHFQARFPKAEVRSQVVHILVE